MIVLFSEPFLMSPISGNILHCVLFLRPSAVNQLPLKWNWQEKSSNGSTSILHHTAMYKLLCLVPPSVVCGPAHGHHLGTLRKVSSLGPPQTSWIRCGIFARSSGESYACKSLRNSTRYTCAHTHTRTHNFNMTILA